MLVGADVFYFLHVSLLLGRFAECVKLCPSSPPAPTQMLEPVTLPGIVSCVLSVLCGGLNLLRGVHAIESILQVRTRASAALKGTLGFHTSVYVYF